MDVTEKLSEHGYRLYDTQDWGAVGGKTMKYQKRVDGMFPDAPLCNMNERLFINIAAATFSAITTFEIQLCHENIKEDWCDLKIYAIPEVKFFKNLVEYEKKLIELWKLFNVL